MELTAMISWFGEAFTYGSLRNKRTQKGLCRDTSKVRLSVISYFLNGTCLILQLKVAKMRLVTESPISSCISFAVLFQNVVMKSFRINFVYVITLETVIFTSES